MPCAAPTSTAKKATPPAARHVSHTRAATAAGAPASTTARQPAKKEAGSASGAQPFGADSASTLTSGFISESVAALACATLQRGQTPRQRSEAQLARRAATHVASAAASAGTKKLPAGAARAGVPSTSATDPTPASTMFLHSSAATPVTFSTITRADVSLRRAREHRRGADNAQHALALRLHAPNAQLAVIHRRLVLRERHGERTSEGAR